MMDLPIAGAPAVHAGTAREGLGVLEILAEAPGEIIDALAAVAAGVDGTVENFNFRRAALSARRCAF